MACHLICLIVSLKEHYLFWQNRINLFFLLQFVFSVLSFVFNDLKLCLHLVQRTPFARRNWGVLEEEIYISQLILWSGGTWVFIWCIGTFWNLHLWQWSLRKKEKLGTIGKGSSEVLWAQGSGQKPDSRDKGVGSLVKWMEECGTQTQGLAPASDPCEQAGRPPIPTCAWPREKYFCCLTRRPEGPIYSLPRFADF